VQHKRRGAALVLLTGVDESGDSADVVRPVDPGTLRPERERPQLGLPGDGLNRADQVVNVDTTANVVVVMVLSLRRFIEESIPFRGCAERSAVRIGSAYPDRAPALPMFSSTVASRYVRVRRPPLDSRRGTGGWSGDWPPNRTSASGPSNGQVS
jgi:hypothetical protein